LPSVVNASCSEAAASTVIVPVTAGAESDGGLEPAPPAVPEDPGEPGEFELDEHPATTTTAAATTIDTKLRRRPTSAIPNLATTVDHIRKCGQTLVLWSAPKG
jgi:hypothetical protein